MKLSKEIWIVIATLGYLISWLIDRLGGPVSIVIGKPIQFLQSSILLNRYPFTATAIGIRTLALFISVMLILSFFKRRYFTKAIVVFFVALLAEFYAIQQLSTGSHLTTVQWTLSIAYASLSMIVGIAWMILMGIWASFNKDGAKSEEIVEDSEESIVKPPKSEE